MDSTFLFINVNAGSIQDRSHNNHVARAHVAKGNLQKRRLLATRRPKTSQILQLAPKARHSYDAYSDNNAQIVEAKFVPYLVKRSQGKPSTNESDSESEVHVGEKAGNKRLEASKCAAKSKRKNLKSTGQPLASESGDESSYTESTPEYGCEFIGVQQTATALSLPGTSERRLEGGSKLNEKLAPLSFCFRVLCGVSPF